jgi:hypothetical protein
MSKLAFAKPLEQFMHEKGPGKTGAFDIFANVKTNQRE